jgi:hypothetical protein
MMILIKMEMGNYGNGERVTNLRDFWKVEHIELVLSWMENKENFSYHFYLADWMHGRLIC